MPGIRTGLALAALAGPALAQSGASGAETYHAPAQNLPGAGGRAASPSFQAEGQLGHPSGGPVALSETFRFEGSAAWTTEGFAGDAPVVFGVEGGFGSKNGSVAERVFGLNFQAPGAGVHTVDLGGVAQGPVTVTSATELAVTTVPGIGSSGNPLGQVDVTVTNANGSAVAGGGYVYAPAIAAVDPMYIGRNVELDQITGLGNFRELYFGLSIPGVGVPIATLDGSFELLALFVLAPGASGFAVADVEQWSFPVPADPALVGASLEWQGSSVDSFAPLAGSLTNRLVTLIQG